MRGCLITFEGGEAMGKTTQFRLLADRLTSQGRDVVRTREPGGTPLGEGIRSLLLDPGNHMDPACEALLYAASRAEHIRRVIAPALEAGSIVLCDRYLDSSLAYQGYGRGLDRDWLLAINRHALEAMPRRTYLLAMRPDEALARKSSGLDRLEREAGGFHRRVCEGFLELAAREPDRFLVLDAAQEPHAVAQRIAADADLIIKEAFA